MPLLPVPDWQASFLKLTMVNNDKTETKHGEKMRQYLFRLNKCYVIHSGEWRWIQLRYLQVRTYKLNIILHLKDQKKIQKRKRTGSSNTQ